MQFFFNESRNRRYLGQFQYTPRKKTRFIITHQREALPKKESMDLIPIKKKKRSKYGLN